MITKIKLPNKSFVWVSIEEENIFSESKNTIEQTGKFICFFKYTPPNLIISGELLRDKDNRPLTFNRQIKAIEFVRNRFNPNSALEEK